MPRREATLADGMRITGSVRARLLGMQLLRIEADVIVAPSQPGGPITPRAAAPKPRLRGELPSVAQNGNGSIGNRLHVAGLALEQASSELTDARRLTP